MDKIDDQDKNLRTVELTQRERTLLLKYGYPFPEEAQRLRDSDVNVSLSHIYNVKLKCVIILTRWIYVYE